MEDYVENYINETNNLEYENAPLLNEVSRKAGWILYEVKTNEECNSCPANLVSQVFPDYELRTDMDYFVGKGEEIYDGDELLQLLYDKESND